jgi:hypothetical protein
MKNTLLVGEFAKAINKTPSLVRHLIRKGYLKPVSTGPYRLDPKDLKIVQDHKRAHHYKRHLMAKIDMLEKRIDEHDQQLNGMAMFMEPNELSGHFKPDDMREFWNSYVVKLTKKPSWSVAEIKTFAGKCWFLSSAELANLSSIFNKPDAWIHIHKLLMRMKMALSKDPRIMTEFDVEWVYKKVHASMTKVELAGLSFLYATAPEKYAALKKEVKKDIPAIPHMILGAKAIPEPSIASK